MSGPESSRVESYHSKTTVLRGRLEKLYAGTSEWNAGIARDAADALVSGASDKSSKDFTDQELREAFQMAQEG